MSIAEPDAIDEQIRQILPFSTARVFEQSSVKFKGRLLCSILPEHANFCVFASLP